MMIAEMVQGLSFWVHLFGQALRHISIRRYYSVENQFEQFQGFVVLISRFEFEFRCRGNFF